MRRFRLAHLFFSFFDCSQFCNSQCLHGFSEEFPSDDSMGKYLSVQSSARIEIMWAVQLVHIQMKKSKHQPFLKRGSPRESALVGAPIRSS
jgi:hypothetical protein